MGMKQNMAALLGIALVVALLATGLFYGLVVMRMDEANATAQPMMIVAARDLVAGSVLAPADVQLAPRDAGGALVEGFSAPAEVVGLTLVKDVSAEAPVTRDILVTENSRGGAALGIEPGYRAISVYVTDSVGVVSLLKPGHRVDAQVVQGGGDGRGTATALRTLLQDLEVLKVEPGREGSAGGGQPAVVTLLARPDEADALGVADAAAEIRLLLRHPLDREITDRARVTLAGQMAQPPVKTQPVTPVSSLVAPESGAEPGAQAVESAGNRAARP